MQEALWLRLWRGQGRADISKAQSRQSSPLAGEKDAMLLMLNINLLSTDAWDGECVDSLIIQAT
jgi:hypothetical protein